MSAPEDHELTEQEMEALKALFDSEHDHSDRWFLLRFQLTLLVAGYYAIALNFFPELVVEWLALEAGTRATEWEFIFRLRGVFITLATLIAIFSYRYDLHMRLIFGSAAMISFINLVMDVPVFYWEKFTAPSVLFVAILLVRVVIVALLFSLYANIARIPEGPRKLIANPFARPRGN